MSARTVGHIDYDLRSVSADYAHAEERGEYGRLPGLQKDLDDLLEERQLASHDLEATTE